MLMRTRSRTRNKSHVEDEGGREGLTGGEDEKTALRHEFSMNAPRELAWGFNGHWKDANCRPPAKWAGVVALEIRASDNES